MVDRYSDMLEAIREIAGFPPSWPEHGNRGLAVASYFAILQRTVNDLVAKVEKTEADRRSDLEWLDKSILAATADRQLHNRVDGPKSYATGYYSGEIGAYEAILTRLKDERSTCWPLWRISIRGRSGLGLVDLYVESRIEPTFDEIDKLWQSKGEPALSTTGSYPSLIHVQKVEIEKSC